MMAGCEPIVLTKRPGMGGGTRPLFFSTEVLYNSQTNSNCFYFAIFFYHCSAVVSVTHTILQNFHIKRFPGKGGVVPFEILDDF